MGGDNALGNGRLTLAERGHDLYETPDVAVRALLKVERLPRRVWEPACGRGAITRVLRAAGHDVLATDLIDYDSPDQDRGGLDFLSAEAGRLFQADAIVTNPPFKDAPAFIRQALQRAPLVVMLLRLSFMESDDGNRRSARNDLLDGGRLARVHAFRRRLPMMHRDGWEGRKANSGMAFAWFVWDRNHSGPTELHRLSWDRE